MKKIDQKKKSAATWFKFLRDKICLELEIIEENNSKQTSKFKKKKWLRDKTNKKDLGGGEMSLLRGKVFEKAGVNISTVYGNFSEKLKGKIPGTEKKSDFWASGISVVVHPFSPKVPAIHMNTRFIVTEKQWFGGGVDITPTDKKSSSSKLHAKLLHRELEKVCNEYDKSYYLKYKKWCDEYFFLPHRKEKRGLGGIFYDYLDSSNWENDFNFTKNVGTTFLEAYRQIVMDSKNTKWTNEDKELQSLRRARYTEFNLLYDRGTKFGLETDGNIEAIFMSLPPSASW